MIRRFGKGPFHEAWTVAALCFLAISAVYFALYLIGWLMGL